MDTPEGLDSPFVTIAISSDEDQARIDDCLRCATSQDYPRDRVEVIVADAMSMDATRETVLAVAAEDPRVSLIDNPERTRAAALNAILRACRGDVIVPMDPGGEYGQTHVTKCVAALSSAAVDQVALVPRTAGRTLVERALSAAQKTRLGFGAGSGSGHDDGPPTLLGAVRRSALARVGDFDEEARFDEDAELASRITRAGGTIAVRRDIVVHRGDVGSYRELLRRQYALGGGRARRIVRTGHLESLRSLTPFGLVSASLALLATSSVQPLTPFAASAYALATGAAAVRVARREGAVTMPIAWAAYPVMHVGQGVGFGVGLARAIGGVLAGPLFRRRAART